MPFSGLRADDIAELWEWLSRGAVKDYGMQVEALDAVIGDLISQSKTDEPLSMQKAIWHATCEWDL
jgi:hypothetical protein